MTAIWADCFGGLALFRPLSRMRSMLWAIVLVCGVAAVILLSVGRARVDGRAHFSQPQGFSALPLAAHAPVSGALGRADGAYRVHGLRAVNRAQRLRVAFSAAGVTVASGSARLQLSLAGLGRRGALSAVGAASPAARANGVRYTRGAGLEEWYVNGPLGLEQGFTLGRRPRGGAGPLELSLSLAGSLRARLASGGMLLSGAGSTLRYGGLSATDARGRTLRSWLSLRGHRLSVVVDDRGAAYPLRIDPFIQQGSKLVGTGAVNSPMPSEQGYSVALSSDGNTAIVGGPYDNNQIGAAWVFVRSGGVWTQQAELIGTGGVGPVDQGWSVALSADGNTALVGGPTDNSGAGAMWVFVRSGSTWTQQGAKLVGTGAVCGGIAAQGFSVALSSDGNTALSGGWQDNCGTGAAWVFTRSGSTWTQQGSKLQASGLVGVQFGRSVALSSDGNTALIGCPGCASTPGGAAFVFTRSGSTWTLQGSALVGTGAVGIDGDQGQSVALSADGNTALIGSDGDNSFVGAAWVFTRSGSTWTQQGSKLVGTGGAGSLGISAQGWSVALSGDGNTALIGGEADNNNTDGATWVFTRSSGAWSQQGSKLLGTGAVSNPGYPVHQGWSVALSGDASTALIGAYGDNSDAGAAWVFTNGAAVQHAMTVTKNGFGSGTVTSSDGGINCGAMCSHSYNAGATVTLTAHAATGSTFAGWSGAGCSGTGTCTVTMSSDQAVTATFKLAAPHLSGVSLSPKSFTAKHGTRVKLTLSAGATVKVVITHILTGHRVKGVCKASAHTGKKCTIKKRAKTLKFAGLAGANSFKLLTKSLKPGSYTATVIATNSAGTSNKVTLKFTIKHK